MRSIEDTILTQVPKLVLHTPRGIRPQYLFVNISRFTKTEKNNGLQIPSSKKKARTMQ